MPLFSAYAREMNPTFTMAIPNIAHKYFFHNTFLISNAKIPSPHETNSLRSNIIVKILTLILTCNDFGLMNANFFFLIAPYLL